MYLLMFYGTIILAFLIIVSTLRFHFKAKWHWALAPIWIPILLFLAVVGGFAIFVSLHTLVIG